MNATELGLLAVMLLLLFVCGCSHHEGSLPLPVENRPPNWAQPISRSGLSNLYKVSDDLYRSAQPINEGFAQARALGIKMDVDLRFGHTEAHEAKKAGLEYERVSFNPLEKPEDAEVVQFLKLVHNKANCPVLVHCLHGSDRTGTMCAAYRICIQGWNKKEAVREMREGGYGFHAQYYESYAKYVEDMDVDRIRKEAGLTP